MLISKCLQNDMSKVWQGLGHRVTRSRFQKFVFGQLQVLENVILQLEINVFVSFAAIIISPMLSHWSTLCYDCWGDRKTSTLTILVDEIQKIVSKASSKVRVQAHSVVLHFKQRK
jgi:hypothetical protein